MKTKDKSLKLAELMGWKTKDFGGQTGIRLVHPSMNGWEAHPYNDITTGLAQFAAILLKFPEVMDRFTMNEPESRPWAKWRWNEKIDDSEWVNCKPTQENILDEILRMNGVDLAD